MNPLCTENKAETLAFLRQLICQYLEIPLEALDFDQPLLDLGADSIVMTTVLNVIKQKYHITIRMMQLFEDIPNVQAIVDYLHEQVSA